MNAMNAPDGLATIRANIMDGHLTPKQVHDNLTQQKKVLEATARTGAANVGSPLLRLAQDLTPIMHGVGLAHILAVEGEAFLESLPEIFYPIAAGFLMHCDQDQIRLCPLQFATVCRIYAHGHVRMNCASQAILALQAAATKICPAESCLTAVEADLLWCCIAAKSYHMGYRWLTSRPVYQVSQSLATKPEHYLRYFYYAGVICIGLKKWRLALDHLQALYVMPARALSALIIEGHKKAVLVSLIHDGKEVSIPKYAPNWLVRQIKTHTTVYDGPNAGIADVFLKGDLVAMQACMTKNAAALTTDENLGLANQAMLATTRRKILNLTNAYLALSLQNISQEVGLSGPKEAEKHLMHMVAEGVINARIELYAGDSGDGIVRFLEDDDFTSDGPLEQLQYELEACAELTKKVRSACDNLASSRQYLTKASRRSETLDAEMDIVYTLRPENPAMNNEIFGRDAREEGAMDEFED